MSDPSLIGFLSFWSCTAISTSVRQYLLLGREAKSDMFSGLSGSIVRAQAGSFYQRSSLCVLHLSVPRPPACIEEAAAAAGLPRVRATNQIVVPFISLTQAVTPTRQAFSRRAFLFWQSPWGSYFVKRFNLGFAWGRKLSNYTLGSVDTSSKSWETGRESILISAAHHLSHLQKMFWPLWALALLSVKWELV